MTLGQLGIIARKAVAKGKGSGGQRSADKCRLSMVHAQPTIPFSVCQPTPASAQRLRALV